MRAVEDEEPERGADVQSDEKDEEERLLDALAADEIVPAKQGGHEHAVSEARHGEELGDPLNEAHDDGLEVTQRGVHASTLNQSVGSACGQRVRQNGAVRYLTIVRHAKAEKAAPRDRSDFDRATQRSRSAPVRATARVGERRARNSALRSDDGPGERRGAHRGDLSSGPLTGRPSSPTRVYSELIYNGLHDVSAEDVLIDLAAVDPVTTSLLVVGHNPTVLELLGTLVDDLPPAVARGLPPRGRLRAGAARRPADRTWTATTLVASYVPD